MSRTSYWKWTILYTIGRGHNEIRGIRRLFSPDLSDYAKDKVVQQFFGSGSTEGGKWFEAVGSVTIFGKLGMVICWYLDGNCEPEYDLKDTARLVKLVPHLLAGKYDKLTEDDLCLLEDALGSFPHRDELLDRVWAVVGREWKKRIKLREQREHEQME